MAHYLKESNIKKFMKAKGKRISKEAIAILEAHVNDCLEKAATVHNGGAKTIDSFLMATTYQNNT